MLNSVVIDIIIYTVSNNMVHVTLWDDLCKQFFDGFNQLNGPDTIFLIVKHARVKEAHGLLFLKSFFSEYLYHFFI